MFLDDASKQMFVVWLTSIQDKSRVGSDPLVVDQSHRQGNNMVFKSYNTSINIILYIRKSRSSSVLLSGSFMEFSRERVEKKLIDFPNDIIIYYYYYGLRI